MRWYVMDNGQTSGPMDGQAVVQIGIEGNLVRGMHVREEDNGVWIRVEQSPFAAHVRDPEGEVRMKRGTRNMRIAFGVVGAGIAASLAWCAIPSSRTRQTPISQLGLSTVPYAAPNPEDGQREAEAAKDGVRQLYAAYDALPQSQKGIKTLVETQKSGLGLAFNLPARRSAELVRAVGREYRARMAPLLSPDAIARGDENTDIVPATNAAACAQLASKWFNDDDTLQAMAVLGFDRMICPDRQWNVRAEAGQCYLYWTGSESDHEKGDPIMIWKDLNRYERQLIAGKARGDDTAMRYLALVSEGAAIVMEGGSYEIVDHGASWLKIQGKGDRAGQDGFVDSRSCHRKPLKAAK